MPTEKEMRIFLVREPDGSGGGLQNRISGFNPRPGLALREAPQMEAATKAEALFIGGFTLIEIIMVVAVIGILGVVILSGKRSEEERVTLSNLRGVTACAATEDPLLCFELRRAIREAVK